MDIEIGGDQILCHLEIKLLEGYKIDNICIENIRLSNSKGKKINIYNSSLTCYGD